MEGVTDPAFRSVVLAEHRPEDLGGAFTEFVRVSQVPVPVAKMSEHLGPRRFGMPVGLQLMGNRLDMLAESARHAIEAGAPLLDINFGCPAKGPVSGCVGSALLDDPQRMEEIVRCVVEAVPNSIVTAKIRAGVRDDRGLEDIARAVEAGGARLLTIHCRTRTEAYREDALDWGRIRRCVEVVSIPVCGNGGITRFEQLEAMRRETGCLYAMVGRGALANPWLFADREVSRAEAARFLLTYAAAMAASGLSPKGVAGRVKQLLNYWTAGNLVGEDRRSWLRESEPARLLERLEAFGERGSQPPVISS
jgi:tRNA-dihydrouridine synthase